MIYFYTQSLKVALPVAAPNELKIIRNWVLHRSARHRFPHTHTGQFRSGEIEKINFIDWILRKAFCIHIHLSLSFDATWPIFITNKQINGYWWKIDASEHWLDTSCICLTEENKIGIYTEPATFAYFIRNKWRRFSQSDTASTSFPFCILSGLRSRLPRVFDLKIKRK